MIRSLCAVVGLVVGFAGNTPALAVIAVRDDSGREVRIAAAAGRIVSLAPHVTELLYEVGAGDRLVASTGYSDYPEAAKRLPRVGGLSGIDLEGVVSLRPDLVIAWQSGTSQAQLEALERLGIPVFRSEPHTLDDVATTLERFGVLSGHVEQGRTAAADFRDRVVALRDRAAGQRLVRVFYQVWNNPLMTVGGPQLITQVIELCGGRNVFASLGALAPIVDAEAVIAADPELLVTASTGGEHDADLVRWSSWTGVSAVRGRHYLFLDPATITRHTSRVLIGAARLCTALDLVRSSDRTGQP